MEYSEGTGSYEAEFLEQILDTGFRYGVPYKIDKKKWDEILEKYGEKTRFKDTDVVKFHSDYSLSDYRDGKLFSYAFYAWPQNSPEGSEDFYECIQFSDYKYNDKHKEAYENFIHEIVKCIICIDHDSMDKLIREKMEERDRISREIAELSMMQVDKKYTPMTKDEIKIGTKVWYHPVIGEPDRREGVITSEPYEMCGTMCCMIDSCTGCVAIEALEKR